MTKVVFALPASGQLALTADRDGRNSLSMHADEKLKRPLRRDAGLLCLQSMGRHASGALGRDSLIVRLLRPAYEVALDVASGRRGIPWSINGVTYRIDPRFRQMLGQKYDHEVAEFLRGRIRPGSVCFDVGANVGVYVLQFAEWSKPGGKVIAFEPNPAARRVLKKHVALNRLDHRVEIVEAAVGAQVGEATFFAVAEDGMSRLGAPNVLIAANAKASTVSVTTIDTYCAKTAVDPDWLLIDIEGFEIEALRGAKELIARRRDRLGIVVEMHPGVWDSAQTTRHSAQELLKDLKFRPVPLAGQADPLEQHGLVYLEPI